MRPYGLLWLVLRLCGSFFVFMNCNGSLCVLTGPNGLELGVFMCPYGSKKFLCVLMDSNGFLWVFIVSYSS